MTARSDATLDRLEYPGEAAEWLAKHRGITFAERLTLAEAWMATDEW